MVKARPSIFDIPTVSDFPDVFPEELPRLPPQREIEVAIDVARTARKTVYSTKCITVGSSRAFC